MVAESLLFTAVWRGVWSVWIVVWSGVMAFSAFVNMVVAWVCCAVVNVSSEVRRATCLAAIVAGSGGVADVSVPNGRCAKSTAAKAAGANMSFDNLGIGVGVSGKIDGSRRANVLSRGEALLTLQIVCRGLTRHGKLRHPPLRELT